LYLVFEGLDGAGKTTQCRLLAEFLERHGWEVVMTREPTSGPWGQKIRSMASSGQQVSIEEEIDWFVQDRKQHIQELIVPSLMAGKAVIQDRYYFSSVAYQGSRGGDADAIFALHQPFCPVPDGVLFLDIPAEEGLRRVEVSRGDVPDAFERLEPLQRSAEIFRGFTMEYFHSFDGLLPAEELHQHIASFVATLSAQKSSR
jgi:dTMP kinase